jgi:dTDP-4-dehydrorhamnose 3,5-epimerase-like enzyme
VQIMAELLNLLTFTDDRGNLTVIEKVIPFNIKRIFYIYGVDGSVRGGHRHKTTEQAAVCIQGSCRIYCSNGEYEEYYYLDAPSKCLFIQPCDWHCMDQFMPETILMVLASTHYNEGDYIFQPYKLRQSITHPLSK